MFIILDMHSFFWSKTLIQPESNGLPPDQQCHYCAWKVGLIDHRIKKKKSWCPFTSSIRIAPSKTLKASQQGGVFQLRSSLTSPNTASKVCSVFRNRVLPTCGRQQRRVGRAGIVWILWGLCDQQLIRKHPPLAFDVWINSPWLLREILLSHVYIYAIFIWNRVLVVFHIRNI